jgi:hypothetical protein
MKRDPLLFHPQTSDLKMGLGWRWRGREFHGKGTLAGGKDFLASFLSLRFWGKKKLYGGREHSVVAGGGGVHSLKAP